MGLPSYLAVFAPRVFIEANGSLATDMLPYITKFEYDDDEAKSDQLKITVANPGLRFKDDKRFAEGARYRVRFGYLSDISDVKNVVISKAKPHFPASGMPTIEMIAFDLKQDLNKTANPKNWGAVSASTIAKAIASRYGFLDVDIEESNDARAEHRLQPANVSDIQFLQSLATKLNWDCYIEGTVLHFHHKRYDAPATLSFQYFTDGTGTLLEFDPEVKMNAPPATQTAGSDTKTATTAKGGDRGASTSSYLIDASNAKVSALVPNSSLSPHFVNGESGLTSGSAESDARVLALYGAAGRAKIQMDAVKARAKFIGTPKLKARTMITIGGVDKILSGNWRISKSKHTFMPQGAIYHVSCDLKRDAELGKSANDNKKDPNGGDGTKPQNRYYIATPTGAITAAK